MFKELAPYLRQRAVLLTVTRLEEDQIRVNVIPQKLKDGENNALTTPLTVTGTAEELDRDLPSTIVNFVSAHLQLKNTLDKAKAEMDQAAKTAAAEAGAKKKAGKKEPSEADTTSKSEPATKPATLPKPEPPKACSLFDEPAAEVAASAVDAADEENETLAEAGQNDEQDQDEDLDEALDEAA
jgi:PRTRC genetic system protein E